MMRPPTDGSAAFVLDDDDEEFFDPYIGLGPIDHRTFDVARRVVDRSGVVELLAEQVAHRAAVRGAGGRPLEVPYRAVVILMLLLALENQPLHVRAAARMVTQRLTPKQRAELGVEKKTHFEKPDAWMHRFHRSVSSMLALMDPNYLPRNMRKIASHAERSAYKAGLDADEYDRRMALLQKFGDRILHATWMRTPAKYRELFKGNYTVDATAFKAAAKGASTYKPMHSVEPDGGWYTRAGKPTPEGQPVKHSFWGHEATIVTTCKPSKRAADNYPLVALALNINAPSHNPGGGALRCFESIRAEERDLPGGFVVGDRAYFAGQNPTAFHLPMRVLGFKPVTDYDRDQLGLQAAHHGAIMVDGNWYSPYMPQFLIDASRAYIDGDIDFKKFVLQIGARKVYALTPKSRPDADGYTRWMCPASLGARSTVLCPVQGNKLSDSPGALPLLPSMAPKHPGLICTNKSDTTFPPDAGGIKGAKYFQELQYGSQKWQDQYGTGRNTIESYNRSIKDQMGLPRNRCLRGHAAQHFLTIICAAAVNIRKVNAFVADRKAEAEGKPKRKARRNQPLSPWRGKYGRQDAKPVVTEIRRT